MAAEVITGIVVTPTLLHTDEGRRLTIKSASGVSSERLKLIRLEIGKRVELFGYYPGWAYRTFSYTGQRFEDGSQVHLFLDAVQVEALEAHD
jgi:hypothetical protein